MKTGEDALGYEHHALDETQRRATRRAMLAKAGLAGSALGLVALTRDDIALADHNLPSPSPAPDSGNLTASNVKDWGALGNGTHNDGPNIQDCIDDSAGQAAVYFPPGTYRIDHPATGGLKLPSNTVLIGQGVLSVLKSGPGSRGYLIINKDAGGNSDIRIENLKLDANRSESSGFVGSGGGKGTAVINIGGSRIYIIGVEALEAGGNTPDQEDGTFHAIAIATNVGAVLNCHVHHCEQDGITTGGSTDLVVQGNVLHDCADDHISIYSSRTSVVGNVINSNDSVAGGAIATRLAEQVKIVGNFCRGGAQSAIVINSSIGAIKEVEVSGNVLVDGGTSTDPGALPYNTNAKSGIMIQPGASPTEGINVTGNTIISPRRHGIALGSPSGTSGVLRDVAIIGNSISMKNTADFEGSGIASIAPGNTVRSVLVEGNEIRNASGAGINVTGSNNRSWSIHDNEVFDSGKSGAARSGITISSVRGVSVMGNRAQDTRDTGKTQDYGLAITSPTEDVVILGNTLTGNSGGTNNGTVNFTGSTAAGRLRVRDNPGFNPWTSDVTVVGPWAPIYPAGFTNPPFYAKSTVINYPVPFPAGSSPKVFLTTAQQGFAASAFPHLGSPNTGFTLVVWYPDDHDPGNATDVKVFWTAEPAD